MERSAAEETPAGMSSSTKLSCCLSEAGCCCGMCCTSGITERQVRDIILKEAGIPDEDLLHYSHSNAVGGHLPYIIALDRWAYPPCSSALLDHPMQFLCSTILRPLSTCTMSQIQASCSTATALPQGITCRTSLLSTGRTIGPSIMEAWSPCLPSTILFISRN